MDAGALLVNSVSVQQARLDESSHIVLLLCAKCSSLLMFCCIMWLMESRGSVEVFKTWHKSLLTFSYFRPRKADMLWSSDRAACKRLSMCGAFL